MFGLFQRATCPIGIDVGSRSIRMLQFRKSGGELSLQGASRVDIDMAGDEPKEGRLAAAIRQGLLEGTYVGREAVISVQPSLLHSKSVRLPPMPDSDLHQALQWEAKDRFGFEIGEGRLVWFRAGEVRRGTEVKDELLLFAAEGSTLTSHLDAATSAGLLVKAIDITPCAGYRSACRAGFRSAGGRGNGSFAHWSCDVAIYYYAERSDGVFQACGVRGSDD